MAQGLLTLDSDYGEKKEHDEEELIVFGYSCKTFRDDAKYKEINNGSLLVPWFDDKSLMIDRFDGRGVLSDLENYDGEVNKISIEPLSTHDRCMEEACNEERFRDLYVDPGEADILEEEERKRSVELVRQDYAAVGFSYDTQPNNNAKKDEPQNKTQPQSSETDESAPYDLPSNIIVPHGYTLPKTEKQGQIIERTAQFIAQQGTQMEIVVKTKQANNSHFNFLQYDSPLNPFYKLLINLIKTGRYVPGLNQQKKETVPKETYQHKTIHEDHYELKLPKVDISNTSYAKLISQFKKDKEKRMNKNNSGTSTPILISNATNQEESASPRTASPAQSMTSLHESNGNSEAQPKSTENESAVASSEQSLSNKEQLYSEYYHHYYSYYYKYYESIQSHYDCSQQDIVDMASNVAASAAASAVQSLSASQYNSENYFSSSEVKTPPDNLRAIIDRLADYVARNGPEFEDIVRHKKQDDRFLFLDPQNEYYAYYQMKREESAMSIKKLDNSKLPRLPISKSDSALKDNFFGPVNESNSNNRDTRSSISFAFKPKPPSDSPTSIGTQNIDDKLSGIGKGVIFALEEDEESATDENESDDIIAQLSKYEPASNSTFLPERDSALDVQNTLVSLEHENHRRYMPPSHDSNNSVRKPEDRLRDQLASAARECLSEVRREADIQAERKRKAAAFMAKLREEKRLREESDRLEKEREKEVAKSKEILHTKEKTPPLAYSSSHRRRSSRSRSPLSKSNYRHSSQR